jgi:hypothetical protein
MSRENVEAFKHQIVLFNRAITEGATEYFETLDKRSSGSRSHPSWMERPIAAKTGYGDGWTS